MTTSDHPFAASAAAANGSQPPSQARLALDNLLRRELRVSDPNDAKAVATALMERYRNNPRTRAIQSEAQGLPFSTAPLSPEPVSAAASTSDGELRQAISDVERSLEDLTTSSLLNAMLPELRGWASAIRSLIQEGSAAAPRALDVSQRDKAFGIRRSLGDFARLARFAGLLTPVVNANYRKLAQSLDEVRAVLLVKMGEVIAAGSFNGNRYLMQAPYTELQARRDAVMHALRNLVGSTQLAYDANSWPRGLDAYGDLYRELESRGHADLRALLNENELARIMDSLIERAAHGESDGMRGLGATAQLDLQKFLRFIVVARRIVRPKSPPMNTFLKALEVFRDAFTRSGGIRLLHIARPLVLFYGLYGAGEFSAGVKKLQMLIVLRGNLAASLDCLSGCCANDTTMRASLVVLDKCIYDLDRAIDILSMCSDENPDKANSRENRILAQGLEIWYLKQCLTTTVAERSDQLSHVMVILDQVLNCFEIHGERTETEGVAADKSPTGFETNEATGDEQSSVVHPILLTSEDAKQDVLEELAMQNASEWEWQTMAKNLTPACSNEELFTLINEVQVCAVNGLRTQLNQGEEFDLLRRLRIQSPAQYEISLQKLARLELEEDLNVVTQGDGE